FHVIQPARGAPGPGAQRAPVVGLAWLAAIRQADDPARQTSPDGFWLAIRIGIATSPERVALPASRIGLDCVWVEDCTSPSRCEQLVFARWRSWPAAARASTSPEPGKGVRFKWGPAKGHQHGDGAGSFLRDRQRHRNIDGDLGTCRIIDHADNVLLNGRLSTGLDLACRTNFPFDAGDIFGNPTVNLAFEQLDDFRPPHLAPLLGGRDALAVLKLENIGQV